MGLFDEVVGGLSGGARGGGIGQAAVKTVLEMLSSRPGGLSGLAAAFQQKGLGDIVSSWIGTGANLPVSPDQVRNVLGSDQIQAFARKAGVPEETAGPQLAELLPGIVDRLTPEGRIPEGGDLTSMGLGLLRNLMSGGTPDPRG